MSIKPIDLQVMMPKVTEVSRIQNDVQQRNHAMQQSTVQSTNKQSESNLKQVVSHEEAQKTAIRERQEKEKQQSKRKKTDKQSDEEEDGDVRASKETTSGRTIDIRL